MADLTIDDKAGSPESLKRHLAWLYPDPNTPCRCDHAYRGLGNLHGMPMGKGWVRTTTHPNCWHHSKCHGYTRTVEAAYKATHPWSIGRWCPVHKNKGCDRG